MSTGLLAEALLRYLPRGRRAGEELAAPCPFHKGGQEKKPSFSVNLETGLAFCHTCHQGWSARTLLRDLGASPREIDEIAGKIPKRLKKNPLKDPQLFSGYELPELLLIQFDRCPVSLLEAGFEMSTLKHFEVGFDRRLDRITYPIRNHDGVLLGLYGRIPDERRDIEKAKYKPYVSELQEQFPGYSFSGRRFLWNLHRVYPDVWFSVTDRVIVVEGFKQAMWVWQCGYKDVVALFGSHLAAAQKTLLQRLGCEYVLFLDNDPAGRQGTMKISETLRRRHATKACIYPEDAHQPDDLSPEEVQECIEGATSLHEWRLHHAV